MDARICSLDSWDHISIGSSSFIQDEVYLNSVRITSDEFYLNSIDIEDSCVINAGSVIMGGINIGNNCSVRLKTWVSQSIPDNHELLGNPSILTKLSSTPLDKKKMYIFYDIILLFISTIMIFSRYFLYSIPMILPLNSYLYIFVSACYFTFHSQFIIFFCSIFFRTIQKLQSNSFG